MTTRKKDLEATVQEMSSIIDRIDELSGIAHDLQKKVYVLMGLYKEIISETRPVGDVPFDFIGDLKRKLTECSDHEN